MLLIKTNQTQTKFLEIFQDFEFPCLEFDNIHIPKIIVNHFY